MKTNHIGCQHKSTLGRTYVGEANTTVDGIPCQKWSDTHPHKHGSTHVGDHNYCRNPYGANDHSHVWCFASDPKHLRQNCSVPFCPSLKAFEFGLDQNEDECFTARHASIKKGNLPWSFTVCTAFKVEAWTKDFALYILSDDKGDDWHWLAILRSDRYTQFAFWHFECSSFSSKSAFLYFPLQWIRICLSMDSNTSAVRLVVNSELLREQVFMTKGKPDNLDLALRNTEKPHICTFNRKDEDADKLRQERVSADSQGISSAGRSLLWGISGVSTQKQRLSTWMQVLRVLVWKLQKLISSLLLKSTHTAIVWTIAKAWRPIASGENNEGMGGSAWGDEGCQPWQKKIIRHLVVSNWQYGRCGGIITLIINWKTIQSHGTPQTMTGRQSVLWNVYFSVQMWGRQSGGDTIPTANPIPSHPCRGLYLFSLQKPCFF